MSKISPIKNMNSIPKALSKKDEFNALVHVYKNPKGYMKDLRQAIGDKLLDEFKSVGFIKQGFTRKAETYGMTKLGKGYVEDLGLDVTV